MRVGSLCSGYEGFALALGHTPVWVADNDTDAVKVLEHRLPGVPNLGDITTVDWTQVEPVELLTAGYPCQPFSHAGKRKGSNDSRHIWPSVAHATGVLRPGVCFLENVAGHVSLGLASVLADLAALGYDASWGVVRAADAGAPHGRARVFISARDATVRGRDAQSATAERGQPARSARGSGLAVADSTGDRRNERRAEPARFIGRPHAAERGPVAPDAASDTGRLRNRNGNAVTDADVTSGEARSGRPGAGDAGRLQPVERRSETQWGDYEPAIRRWERTLSRSVPRSTDARRVATRTCELCGCPDWFHHYAPCLGQWWKWTERLAPRFVEWMMGLPAGWVTDVPQLSRNAQLRLLGNGIVPQQAALAWTVLNRTTVADRVAA